MKEIYTCYSAGPGLFPRFLPEKDRCESWEEAQERVRALNATITDVPEFKVITPSNADLFDYPNYQWPRLCCLKDLYFATQSDITFADVTPFGGREPDSGTIVEAVACALSGNLLVLWADPLTSYTDKYADADVHPETSFMSKHYNLMLEQLYRWNWEVHFGVSCPVFSNLREAAQKTARLIRKYDLQRVPLIDKICDKSNATDTMAIAIAIAEQSFA